MGSVHARSDMASDHAKWKIIRDDDGDIVVGVDMTDRSRSRFPGAGI